MIKQRIEGRIVGNRYQVHAADGSVMLDKPIDEAHGDAKLAAAIKRNGWQEIPEG